MDDLRSEYYAAFQRRHGISYQDKYSLPAVPAYAGIPALPAYRAEIEIKGSWFILQSCKVQRAMFQTMIDRLNARG